MRVHVHFSVISSLPQSKFVLKWSLGLILSIKKTITITCYIYVTTLDGERAKKAEKKSFLRDNGRASAFFNQSVKPRT